MDAGKYTELQWVINLTDSVSGTTYEFRLVNANGRPVGVALAEILANVAAVAALNMKVKIDNVWRQVSSAKIFINGEWKNITSGQMFINGEWK